MNKKKMKDLRRRLKANRAVRISAACKARDKWLETLRELKEQEDFDKELHKNAEDLFARQKAEALKTKGPD